jgi:hypothetical protein
MFAVRFLPLKKQTQRLLKYVACSLLLTSLSFTLYLIPSFRSTIDQTLTVCDRTRQENGSQTSSSREGHSTFDCRSEQSKSNAHGRWSGLYNMLVG